MNGKQIHYRRAALKRVPTGSQVIDDLLGGGIESESITEIFGESQCGKTQFSHTLAVNSFKLNGGQTVYIDTENTFRPERIADIAEAYGLDENEVLNSIKVARAYTVDNLSRLLFESALLLREGNYNLIVVDSIMAPFRVDFSGRGELCYLLNS